MSTRTRIATVLALCAAGLVSCAEEAPETDSASAESSRTEPEPDETELDDVPIVASGIAEENDDTIATAVEEESDDDAPPASTRAVVNALDEDLCGVPEGGLDLPTPEMHEVVITGFDEDTSRVQRNTLSNAGTYRVMIDLNEADGVAVGGPFSMAVTFEMTDGSQVPGGVFLDLTAYMPQHFHGLNVDPDETPTTRGRYEVDNIVFHMTGLWEVYLDLTHRGVTERAQFVFEVK